MASARPSKAASKISHAATKSSPAEIPRPRPKPVSYNAALPRSLRTPPPRRVDLSSPAYKAASRKYIGFMIATPILLVTSYVLFDRLVMGNEAKSLKRGPAMQDAV
ncbi:hypothetical protein BJ170DRAFT_149647 [Xylariales sp. AK1849]|nr:hypothetical protein BJ170DRAFT_149647 [Xylariales sp. AK1849]